MTFSRSIFLFIIYGWFIFGSFFAIAIDKYPVIENELEQQKIEQEFLEKIEQLERVGFDYPDSSILELITLQKELNDTKMTKAMGALLQTLGRLYYVKGNYLRSYEVLEKARLIWEELGNREGLSAVLNNLGLVSQMRQEYDQARNLHNNSLQLALEVGNNFYVSKNLFNLAIIENYTGRNQIALHLLDSAESFLNGETDPLLPNMIASRRGEVLTALGDYEEALDAYDASLKNKPNNWEKTFALSGKAAALLALNRLPEAMEFAKESCSMAEESNAHWELQRSLAIISGIYEKQGDFANALEAFKRHKIYADCVFNRDREWQLSSLMLESERLKTALLEEENLLKASQLSRKNTLIAAYTGLFIVFLVLFISIIRLNRTESRLNRELLQKNSLIGDQHREIESKNKALVKENETKDRILGVISHDIRSPMASIQQALDLITEHEFNPQEQQLLLNELSSQVAATSETLNTLLNWAMVQMQENKPKPELVDIAKHIDYVKQSLGPSAKKKKVHLMPIINPGAIAWMDRTHLEIILRNLLNNAIKFSTEDGKIQFALAEQDGMIKMKISDSGVGMEKEKLEKLFKEFGSEISSFGTANEQGTGLGLVLVQYFVKQNHGKIKVESMTGKGTTFTVYLPQPKTLALH